MFWEFGQHFVGKPLPENAYQTRSPNIAMLEGDWKMLINYDGSRPELYNLKEDVFETVNLAEKDPERAKRMGDACIAWYKASFRQHAGELQPVPEQPKP